MSKKVNENLARVKKALAEKYENLARVVPSKPRQKSWLRLAAKFRRQAEQAARKAT